MKWKISLTRFVIEWISDEVINDEFELDEKLRKLVKTWVLIVDFI